jgi:G3E family GTPase
MNEPVRDSDEDHAIPDAPLPVSVLTGFLGSGKTTLLRYLLSRPGMANTAVIVNEFGEIGLDHLLVEKIDENAVLLNSGCLCCTVRGDLVEALRRLFKQRVKREIPPFERVVIETTGLADPAPVLQTLMTDPLVASRYRLDGVVTTVDGILGESSLDRHLESRKQAAVAERIVITKTDLADPADIAALSARLRALNPAASILEAVEGRIEPEALFESGLYNPETDALDVERWLHEDAYQADDHTHAHHDHAHDVNRHGGGIRAFCLTYDKPLDWDRFNSWIEMLLTLYGAGLLRIKGILNVAGFDRPLVIHGVQHVFHPPAQLECWPGDDRRSKIVFITHDLEEAMFADTLKAFNEDSADPLARRAT